MHLYERPNSHELAVNLPAGCGETRRKWAVECGDRVLRGDLKAGTEGSLSLAIC